MAVLSASSETPRETLNGLSVVNEPVRRAARNKRPKHFCSSEFEEERLDAANVHAAKSGGAIVERVAQYGTCILGLPSTRATDGERWLLRIGRVAARVSSMFPVYRHVISAASCDPWAPDHSHAVSSPRRTGWRSGSCAPFTRSVSTGCWS
jgi:hypothetical protein